MEAARSPRGGHDDGDDFPAELALDGFTHRLRHRQPFETDGSADARDEASLAHGWRTWHGLLGAGHW